MTRTALGMPAVRPAHGHGNIVLDEPFPSAARTQLGNAQMRANIHHATHTIRGKRARVVGELPDWAELRQAGSALKQQVMADLPALLEDIKTPRDGRLYKLMLALEAGATIEVIAPDATDAAREVFAAKKNLRLLTTGGMPDPHAGGLTFRQVAGGFLVPGRDNGHVARADLRVVTQRAPTEAELADLMFAWTVAKHVKSNAIVYARDGATVGIGAGQMSRVDSTRIGRRKSEDMAEALGLTAPLTEGAAVASDAFFPFPDGIEALAAAGARAVIQPGGSMRDAEVIAAADRLGLAMVFTGQRHFRH